MASIYCTPQAVTGRLGGGRGSRGACRRGSPTRARAPNGGNRLLEVNALKGDLILPEDAVLNRIKLAGSDVGDTVVGNLNDRQALVVEYHPSFLKQEVVIFKVDLLESRGKIVDVYGENVQKEIRLNVLRCAWFFGIEQRVLVDCD